MNSDGFFYLAANKETARKLETQFGSMRYVLRNNVIEQTKIIIESGIDCEPGEIYPTSINKERYCSKILQIWTS